MGDIITEQLGGDKFIEQQHPADQCLTEDGPYVIIIGRREVAPDAEPRRPERAVAGVWAGSES